MNNEFASLAMATTDMISDRRFLIIGAVSLLVILAWLYRGGWKDAAKMAATLLFGGLFAGAHLAIVFSVFLFLGAIFGPEDDRASHFLVAAIYGGFAVVVLWTFRSNNALTRALKKHL